MWSWLSCQTPCARAPSRGAAVATSAKALWCPAKREGSKAFKDSCKVSGKALNVHIDNSFRSAYITPPTLKTLVHQGYTVWCVVDSICLTVPFLYRISQIWFRMCSADDFATDKFWEFSGHFLHLNWSLGAQITMLCWSNSDARNCKAHVTWSLSFECIRVNAMISWSERNLLYKLTGTSNQHLDNLPVCICSFLVDLHILSKEVGEGKVTL